MKESEESFTLRRKLFAWLDWFLHKKTDPTKSELYWTANKKTQVKKLRRTSKTVLLFAGQDFIFTSRRRLL
jgi:hypothetical protein